jgi:hypothetical protein
MARGIFLRCCADADARMAPVAPLAGPSTHRRRDELSTSDCFHVYCAARRAGAANQGHARPPDVRKRQLVDAFRGRD